MFALPNSKRVRRDELDSPSSSRASSPDLDILDKLRANSQFDLIEISQPPPQSRNEFLHGEKAEDEEEEELAFNLFAPIKPTTTDDKTTTPPTAIPQTIRIRSPTPLGSTDPGFVVPTRNLSYYFASVPNESKKAEYAATAVTGTTIHSWSKLPCPGCIYPWKIISIPSSAAKKALAFNNPAEEKFLPDAEREEKKKKRLGKNARIKKRVKAEKNRVRKELAEQGKEEKERAEREKRARRNREKKFKKRARDKAKKAGGGGDVGGGDDDENDSDGDGEGGDAGGIDEE